MRLIAATFEVMWIWRDKRALLLLVPPGILTIVYILSEEPEHSAGWDALGTLALFSVIVYYGLVLRDLRAKRRGSDL